MSEPVWKENFYIHTHEADMNGLARLDALFCCFQEAAGHHARSLGAGRDDLERKGCFWVLSRCWMQIERYPLWGQQITVRTWPRGVARLFALRDFQFLSADGQLLGSGVSAWLILNRDKHRPLKPGPFLQGIAPTQEPTVSGDVLEKQGNARGLSELRRFSVRYSDLDVNRHVNNAAYVRWILDSFDAERHDRLQIVSIRIDYLSETVLGESITVQAQAVDPAGRQVLLGVRPDMAQPVFQATILWRERSPA
jgi:medium-chain acyl-[acyl-carrier-protein] hydrolase